MELEANKNPQSLILGKIQVIVDPAEKPVLKEKLVILKMS